MTTETTTRACEDCGDALRADERGSVHPSCCAHDEAEDVERGAFGSLVGTCVECRATVYGTEDGWETAD